MNQTTRDISRLLCLALDAERAGDTENARRLYARCLALDDGSDSLAHYRGYRPVRCSAWLLQARFLEHEGDAPGALELLERAVDRWPLDADLHVLAGLCHGDRERFDLAEQAYRRALALERVSGTLLFLGQALDRQDREDEALACLREALEVDPNDDEVLYNMGRCLRTTGDLEAAAAHLRRAIGIDPDYAIAHAELANVLRMLGRTRQARRHYEAAARLRPDDGLALARWADFLSEHGGSSAAVEPRFARAVKLAPQDPSVHFYYGRHLLRAGRYVEARRELLLADRLGSARALEALATFEWDAGSR